MTNDVKRNFLGIPISGTVCTGDVPAEQYPCEDFEKIVSAVLANQFITEFGWSQYTPYFNDGAPCVFSAHGVWVRTQRDEAAIAAWLEREAKDSWGAKEYDETDREHLGLDGDHPTLGWSYWADGYGSEKIYVGQHQVARDLADVLSQAIQGGHFDNVLLDLFGDHCEVTVRRTGITIDEYSHD